MTVKHFFMDHGIMGKSQLSYPHCPIPGNLYILYGKNESQGRRFQDAENITDFKIKNNVTTALNAVPLDASNDYATYRKNAISRLQSRQINLKANKITF